MVHSLAPTPAHMCGTAQVRKLLRSNGKLVWRHHNCTSRPDGECEHVGEREWNLSSRP